MFLMTSSLAFYFFTLSLNYSLNTIYLLSKKILTTHMISEPFYSIFWKWNLVILWMFWPKKCWHHQKILMVKFSWCFGKLIRFSSLCACFSLLPSFLKVLDWGGVILPLPMPLRYIKKSCKIVLKVFRDTNVFLSFKVT